MVEENGEEEIEGEKEVEEDEKISQVDQLSLNETASSMAQILKGGNETNCGKI